MAYSILSAIGQMEMTNNATCENPCVILTGDNIFVFCDDIELPQPSTQETFNELGLLPVDFLPFPEISIPVIVNTNSIAILSINTSGVVSCTAYGTIHTRGIAINCNSEWYTNELGNNLAQGTSPLTEV